MAKDMNLTAQEIYEKEFHVDLKGYAPAEVDEFLDMVIEDYQKYDEKVEELGAAVTRYEEKIKELNYNFAIKNDECVRCINICERCEFISNPFGSCPQNKIKWLYKKYIEPKPKVKIPLATKYFLESLNDKYEWIAKDEDGAVWCYKFKPEKYTQDKNKRWTVYGRGNIAGFRDVFKKEIFDFLSWEDEEPTLIQNILDNCEVIEDE